MMDEASGLGCEGLFHLGDLTEHKNPKSSEMDAAAELFSHWLKKDHKNFIHAIAGNHDGSKFDISSSSLEPLAKMAPGRFSLAHDISSGNIGDASFVSIPYQHNMSLEEIARQHKALGPHGQGNPFLCIHYGVTNSVVGPNNVVLPSDMLGKEQLIPKNYKVIFAGHIHKQQVVKIGGVDVVFPGSPLINDFGERQDTKGYAIYDTDTGKYTLHEIKSKRGWVQVEWPFPLGEGISGKTPWQAGDLVKVVGSYKSGTAPKDEIFDAVRDGLLPEPFVYKWDLKREAEERAARSEEIAEAATIQEAVKALVGQKAMTLPDDVREQVITLILDHLRDSQRALFGTKIRPTELGLFNFMTYADVKLILPNGVPHLIWGENGLGKTNIVEGILYVLTGKTSKGLTVSSLLRRGADKGSAYLKLLNESGEQLEILRTMKRSSKGAVTQKVELAFTDKNGEEHDWTDGNKADVQTIINESLGITFASLRASNFMFQRDNDPLVTTKPLNRKQIFGEVMNHGPIKKAKETMDETRKEVNRDRDASFNKLQGMTAVFSGDEGKRLRDHLAQVKKDDLVSQQTLTRAQEFEDAAVKEKGEATDKEVQTQKEYEGLPNTQAALDQANSDHRVETMSWETLQTGMRGEFDRAQEALQEATSASQRGDLTTLRGELAVNTGKLEAFVENIEVLREKLSALTGKRGANTGQITATNEKIKELEGKETGDCSLCSQPIDSSHIEQELKQLSKDLEYQELERAVLFEEDKVLQQQLNDIGLDQNGAEKEKNRLNNVITSLESAKADVVKYQEELNSVTARGVKTKEEALQKIEQLRQYVEAAVVDHDAGEQIRQAARNVWDDAREALSQAQDKMTAQAELRVQADERCKSIYADTLKAEADIARFEKTETEIEELGKAVYALEQKKILWDCACQMLDPKTGLPIYLLDVQIPYLQDRINKYLSEDLGSELFVELLTQDGDKEVMDVVVDDGHGDRMDIRVYSGGQLGRIEIAFKQALCDLSERTRGTRLELLCLDEPTDGLDERGKQALIDMLYRRCAEQFPATLVISHDEKLLSSFNQRIKVEGGEGGASKLSGAPTEAEKVTASV